MGTLRNTFRSFADGSCHPRDWESYFLRFDPVEWDKESGGVLQYFTDDGVLQEYSDPGRGGSATASAHFG
jgi:hypothetical protein